MKRALLVSLLVAACGKSQDPALLVTMSGPFGIPANADSLTLDVLDSGTTIAHRAWCVTPTASCEQLPTQAALSGSVTLVQGATAHTHVKLNAILKQGTSVVGLGTQTADFSDGRTVDVQIVLSPP